MNWKNQRILLVFFLLISTFILGVLTQKYYGLGRLLVLFKEKPEKQISPSGYGPVDIYILAGQSNMEGDGDIADYLYEDNERVFVFDESYTWKPAKEPIRDKVGPSMSFARQLLLNDSGRVVGIINCAKGGTNITQWKKDVKDNSFYARMIKRALAASLQGEIKGFLFFQGEDDAEGDPEDHPDDWDRLFLKLVEDVRNDLGNPNLPVVFAQIGNDSDVDWETVKESQNRVRGEGITMIKTDDIVGSNGKHFTTQGYIEIGERFADAIIKLQRNSKNQ